MGQEDPRHAPAAKQIAEDVAIVDLGALYGASGVAFEGPQLGVAKSWHCFPLSNTIQLSNHRTLHKVGLSPQDLTFTQE